MPIAKLGRVDLCYDERGEGEPLLLVMGFSAQMILWDDRFCDRLAREGFRVIRFDNRDVGESTRFDQLGVPDAKRLLLARMLGQRIDPPYTIEDMADDGLALLEHLGVSSAHVVGASMGGMIGQSMAIRAPSRVRTLTSIMSSPGGRRYSVGHPKALSGLLRKPASTRDEHVEGFVSLFRVLSGEGYPFPEAHLREVAARCWERGIHPRGAARQFAAILASDRRKQLPSLRVPTLVVHGTEDPLLPERAGRATARLVPGARYLPVDGMGHHMPEAAWPLLVGAIASHAHASR